uniref:Major facilitator superfamily (MFS) profile domain-containing protein n=1 Tax=Globisporangium ultimum (strain ATCC 200006 / CBS 805.95 / DAOM BR144) TaxID=431595 RepID=K3WZ63_GLOUD
MAQKTPTYGAVSSNTNQTDLPPVLHVGRPTPPSSSYTRIPGKSEYLFKYLIITQVCMYLEAGAVPSLLQQFTLTFHLSPQEQGLLGAIVYISISLASPWCSTLFRKFCPRQLLGLSLVVNNLAVFTFALTPTLKWYSKSLLICSRGFIGLTQAFFCVYSPLWVHEYAPKAKRGAWMSYLQAATPLGITLGYFAGSVTVWLASSDPSATTGAATDMLSAGTANATSTASSFVSSMLPGVLNAAVSSSMNNVGDHLFDDMVDTDTNYCQGMYCWRWPFLFQFLAILPFAILIFFVPVAHIRLHNQRRRSIIMVDSIITANETEEEDDDEDEAFNDELSRLNQAAGRRPSLSQDLSLSLVNLGLLFQQKVYVFIVLALSALFFVVAGIQFWTTLYLATNTNDSLYTIHTAYLLVSGTGPIIGVFFGGWLIDQFGGYAGLYQRAEALRVCMVLGALGGFASIPVTLFRSTVYIAIFLWLMLFCGGAILPACSGIVISSAPRRLRPLASSVAYASYNLLGYAASNYIPGLIMNFIITPHVSDDDSDLPSGACDTACTYRVGFRIVLSWCAWAFFCLTCAYSFAKDQVEVARKRHDNSAEVRHDAIESAL